jgi:hypothetical protein
MSWSLGGVTIFPQGIDDMYPQTIARLQPLASGTIYHAFGWESDIKKISALIVGSVDKIALRDFTRTGLTYSLFNDTFDWGTYYVKGVSFKYEPVVFQTIRPDLSCEATVYSCEIELWKIE